MTGLNHVLTGTAVALIVREPLFVAPLAFLSHFVLDIIPHFDHPVYRWGSKYFVRIMATDAILSIGCVVLTMVLLPQLAVVVALGAFMAILPDLFWPIYYKRGRPQVGFFKFHSRIQWYEKPPGALVELSYLVFISTALIAIT